MTPARRDGLSFLLIGAILFVLVGASLELTSPISMLDFKVLYYGTRCMIEHCDPYDPGKMKQVYVSESVPSELNKEFTGNIVSSGFIYLPAATTFTMPFALLPWGAAQFCWTILTGGLFILATFLTWELTAIHSPIISGALLGLLLGGSVLLLEIGNAAGIVVSCCAIALWCFHRERLAVVGVTCLAIGLMVKPHDAGVVWICLFLAGGIFRKRSLQSLLVALILGLPPTLWIAHIAPNWIHELQTTLSTSNSRGGVMDPGPLMVDPRAHGAMPINLQTAVSVIRDDPKFYNTVTWVICTPLFLIWTFVTVRSMPSPNKFWLGLAAFSALMLLPIYHRQHDTRILMLSIPGCAILWENRDRRSRFAAAITGAAILFTGDLPSQILALRTHWLIESTSGIAAKILLIVFDRPGPILLLAMSAFYVWVYAHQTTLNAAKLTPRIYAPNSDRIA